MTISATNVLSRASQIIQDTTNVRWPIDELVQWFNDAQREVVLHRPDANPQTAPVLLATGTRQKLISGAATVAGGVGASFTPFKLLEVICNCTATGASITARGNAVRLVEREVLDAQQPSTGWHDHTVAGNSSATAKHYTYDPRDPLAFYVYPPQPATSPGKVEVLFSAYPVNATVSSGAVVEPTASLPDIYGNAILDYVLYRAYSKDAAYAGNAQRAQFHYGAFANSLGIELRAKLLVGPTGYGEAGNPNAAPMATLASIAESGQV